MAAAGTGYYLSGKMHEFAREANPVAAATNDASERLLKARLGGAFSDVEMEQAERKQLRRNTINLREQGILKLDESCISNPKSEISDWTD